MKSIYLLSIMFIWCTSNLFAIEGNKTIPPRTSLFIQDPDINIALSKLPKKFVWGSKRHTEVTSYLGDKRIPESTLSYIISHERIKGIRTNTIRCLLTYYKSEYEETMHEAFEWNECGPSHERWATHLSREVQEEFNCIVQGTALQPLTQNTLDKLPDEETDYPEELDKIENPGEQIEILNKKLKHLRQSNQLGNTIKPTKRKEENND